MCNFPGGSGTVLLRKTIALSISRKEGDSHPLSPPLGLLMLLYILAAHIADLTPDLQMLLTVDSNCCELPLMTYLLTNSCIVKISHVILGLPGRHLPSASISHAALRVVSHI